VVIFLAAQIIFILKSRDLQNLVDLSLFWVVIELVVVLAKLHFLFVVGFPGELLRRTRQVTDRVYFLGLGFL